jgi:hypothetical protein
MDLWTLLVVICLAGGTGGLINSIMVEDGFHLPNMADGILRPGFLGNILTGAAAAGASWGLYGPFSAASVLGPQPTGAPAVFNMSLAALIGAFFVGMGGARWLTTEVDKRLEKTTNTVLTTAMSAAASTPIPSATAQNMQTATSTERLKMAKQIAGGG